VTTLSTTGFGDITLVGAQGHAVLRRRRPESAVPKRERGHYEERIG
jgi:hypothetical protein